MSIKTPIKQTIGLSLKEYDKLNITIKDKVVHMQDQEKIQQAMINGIFSEINDNHIETDELSGSSVDLLNSKKGVIEVKSIKGNSIVEDGVITSVGEENNKIVFVVSNETQTNTTEVLLTAPLRSLPNGVCDEIQGNKVIRRVGTRSKKIAVADVGIVDINVVD